MNIEVQIDSLVIHGITVESDDAAVLGEAMRGELTRLLAMEGIAPGLAAGGTRGSLVTPDIVLDGDSSALEIGRRIGRAVYGGISR